MTLRTLGSALAGPEFTAGLLWGLVALAAGLAVAARARGRAGGPPVGVAGLAFAAAFAGGAAQILRPGDLLPDGLRWLAVGVGLAAGGWLLADFDGRWRDEGLGPVLLTVSVAGVYATVPDTEAALVALGAAVPVSLLAWPRPLACLGRAGAYAAAGVVSLVVATGGAGRASSMIGGAACLGLLAVEPLARRLRGDAASALERLPGRPWRPPLAVAAQLLLVYVASRVAGTRPGAAQAAAIVLPVLAAAVAAAVAATPRPVA